MVVVRICLLVCGIFCIPFFFSYDFLENSSASGIGSLVLFSCVFILLQYFFLFLWFFGRKNEGFILLSGSVYIYFF